MRIQTYYIISPYLEEDTKIRRPEDLVLMNFSDEKIENDDEPLDWDSLKNIKG